MSRRELYWPRFAIQFIRGLGARAEAWARMLTLLLDKETRIQAGPLGKLRLFAANRVPAREGGGECAKWLLPMFRCQRWKVGTGTAPWSPAAAFGRAANHCRCN